MQNQLLNLFIVLYNRKKAIKQDLMTECLTQKHNNYLAKNGISCADLFYKNVTTIN